MSWSSYGRVSELEMPVSKATKRVLGMAGEHGLRSGITSPIRTSGERAALATFANDCSNDERVLVPIIGSACLIGSLIHQAVVRIKRSRLLGQPLSDRELTVLELGSRGLSNKGIARELGISPRTSAHHLEAIRRKLQVTTIAAAVRKAMDLELI